MAEHTYRWGGFTLVSDLALRRLHPGPGTFETLTFTQTDEEAPPPPTDDVRTVRFLDGTTTEVAAGPHADKLVVRLSGIGTFAIGRDHVTLHRDPDASDDDVEHFLVNAVLSNLAGLRGELCLHASSVCRDGRAVLIGGPSGAGKSHLAAAMVEEGWQLLSDDHTVVRRTAEGWTAYPGPRTVRVAELRREGSWINRGKREAFVPSSPEPATIDRLLFLGQTGPHDEATLLRSLIDIQGGWRWTHPEERKRVLDAAARLISEVEVELRDRRA